MKKVLIFLVEFYRKNISPMTKPSFVLSVTAASGYRTVIFAQRAHRRRSVMPTQKKPPEKGASQFF